MKTQLIKRLRYLWFFELLDAIVIFPFIRWSYRSTVPIRLFSLYAISLVGFILVIGAAFWYLKYRDLIHGTNHLQQSRPFFRLMKYVIPVPLLVLPFLFQKSDAAFGCIFGILALLEYINYFYIQLMYDNRADLRYLLQTRRLKRATLARELDL
jgi:hypothetical protein